VVVGLLTLVGTVAGVEVSLTKGAKRGEPSDHDHAHDHDHPSRVGLMLVAPLVAVLLVAPTALGSSAASARTLVVDPSAQLGPLPPVIDGVVTIGLLEVMQRAAQGTAGGLEGLQLRLIGFVSERFDGGFVISRFRIACCAADALVASVRVVGSPAPRLDEWVVVIGAWDADEPDVSVIATSVDREPAPANPYD
jgi:uncharacterized repeat protein (TIGR03943 family)